MSDPFDISKALEGAAVESLSPEVSRFKMNSEYDVAGDQEKAIEELLNHGANPLLQSQKGQTPLSLAEEDSSFKKSKVYWRMKNGG